MGPHVVGRLPVRSSFEKRADACKAARAGGAVERLPAPLRAVEVTLEKDHKQGSSNEKQDQAEAKRGSKSADDRSAGQLNAQGGGMQGNGAGGTAFHKKRQHWRHRAPVRGTRRAMRGEHRARLIAVGCGHSLREQTAQDVELATPRSIVELFIKPHDLFSPALLPPSELGE